MLKREGKACRLLEGLLEERPGDFAAPREPTLPDLAKESLQTARNRLESRDPESDALEVSSGSNEALQLCWSL
ncbi:MAG: hypothetical protein KDD47_26180 [Acidobacteria bacterium]|nr:hypothetical protein [Acidobacteriota bacterium]